MSVNAARSVAINLTGDVILDKIYSATLNTASPGSVTIHSLVTGNNTITLPVSTGVVVKAATIVPPSTNVQAILLKGVGGDTGIALSKTDPTTVTFDTPSPANFVLNAGADIPALRIVWT